MIFQPEMSCLKSKKKRICCLCISNNTISRSNTAMQEMSSRSRLMCQSWQKNLFCLETAFLKIFLDNCTEIHLFSKAVGPVEKLLTTVRTMEVCKVITATSVWPDDLINLLHQGISCKETSSSQFQDSSNKIVHQFKNKRKLTALCLPVCIPRGKEWQTRTKIWSNATPGIVVTAGGDEGWGVE